MPLNFKTENQSFNIGHYFPKLSDSIFAHLKEESRAVLENKIKIFMNIHAIRELYGKQCYLGFVGPQNAGKSTLLNILWGKNAETGMFIHTEEPTKYHVANEIFAIDFPGSTSLTDQLRETFENVGHMNNFQVYVIQYNGSPDTQLIENIKMAYRMKKISGKFSKTLFCLNKASLLQGKDNTAFDDEFRHKYVNSIREHIKSQPYDKKVEGLWQSIRVGIKKNAANKAYEELIQMHEKLKQYSLAEMKMMISSLLIGKIVEGDIKGPEEVRRRIRQFLVKSKILSWDQAMTI